MKHLALLLCTCALPLYVVSQSFPDPGRKGQLYFSWGYNKEWYTPSTIHVEQKSLGNDYSFVSVIGKDKPGWDERSILEQDLSIPQYNYRLGYWFKDDWAVEINFDHTKYQVEQQQLLHVEGVMNNQKVDDYMINRGNLKWQLNNGANFFLFNIVHRKKAPYLQFRNFNAAFLFKGGVGFMVPHVENTIFGKNNKPGFQFGGLDVGAEAGLQLTFFRYVYLEYTNKLVYANYWGLNVYEGTARQDFICYEMVLSLGVNVPIISQKPKKKSLILQDANAGLNLGQQRGAFID